MRLFFLTFLLFSPAIICAEDAHPVRCRFLSFGAAEDPVGLLTLNEKGAEIPCPLPTGALSKPVVCFAKDNLIAFFAATADKLPVATATIPAGLSAVLLIFVPVPHKPGDATAKSANWRVLVIEDSPKNFPDGGAFVANFYKQDIRFIIGEHKGMLHAAGSHGYPLPEQRNAFNMAPVVFELLQDDKWNVASESAMRFIPGIRYLIFAYEDPVSSRPRINIYPDIATPAVPVRQKP